MTEKAKKKPSHTAYVVTGKGNKAIWREIGAVWLHGDGEGFDLSLDAVPLSGRIVCRQRKPKLASE